MINGLLMYFLTIVVIGIVGGIAVALTENVVLYIIRRIAPEDEDVEEIKVLTNDEKHTTFRYKNYKITIDNTDMNDSLVDKT